MELAAANKLLDSICGRKDPNYPRFRIVFSDDILEKQLWEKEWAIGDKPISSQMVVLEVPKYRGIVSGCFILEVHMPTDEEAVIDKAGNYEPLYVFRDEHGNPLPLEEDVIITLANGFNVEAHKSPSQLQTEYDDRMAREAAIELAMFDDHLTYFNAMRREGSAVFVDSTKKFNG